MKGCMLLIYCVFGVLNRHTPLLKFRSNEEIKLDNERKVETIQTFCGSGDTFGYSGRACRTMFCSFD